MELENQFLDCGSCKLFSVSVTSCHKTRVPEYASQSLTGAQGAETNRRLGRSSFRSHRPAGELDSLARDPKTTRTVSRRTRTRNRSCSEVQECGKRKFRIDTRIQRTCSPISSIGYSDASAAEEQAWQRRCVPA